MKDKWQFYKYGNSLLAGDIVMADLFQDNSLTRVELLGKYNQSLWWCKDHRNNKRYMLSMDCVREINVNENYFNIRINYYEGLKKQADEEIEILKSRLEKCR